MPVHEKGENMKLLRFALAVMITFSAQLVFSESSDVTSASDAQKQFEQLKTLVGTWQGIDRGKPVQVQVHISGDGSAIVHETKSGPVGMLTVFYLDGDRLMLTHFCAAHNQPRMIGKLLPDGKTIQFDFLDGTNISNSRSYLRSLSITFGDKDRA
jgi:hypothetical protein